MTICTLRSTIAIAAILPGLSTVLCPARAWSQQRTASPLLTGIEIGRYAVGFQSFWVHDGSRTWRSFLDVSRREISASPLRPVRINVWYPASVSSGTTMTFGDYLGSAQTPGFTEDETRVRSDDLGAEGRGLRGLFKSQTAFADLMKTRTLAHRNASVAHGKFPIVVYSLGQGDYTQEDTPLCEYLASRGFVIISVPGLGTSPRRSAMFVHDPPSYDNQVRDLAFALATVVARFPNADGKRVAAMGHSMGGVYALMLAMRYSIIRTVVGLDPSFVAPRPSYFYRYQDAPEYDAGNFTGSLLAIHKRDDNEMAIVDSLRFTDRTVISVDSAVHADFNGFPMYTGRAPVSEVDTFAVARRSQATAMNTYRGVARYVARYLEEHLGAAASQSESYPTIQRSITTRIPRAEGPTEEELYDIMRTDGVTRARAVIENARGHGLTLGLRRATMQRIANELGYLGKNAESASYSGLITLVFPEPAVSSAMRSNSPIASAGNSKWPAPRFSRRWSSEDVPGISRIFPAR